MLKYGQLLTRLSRSMNSSGMRVCFNSGFIVIAIVSCEKDIIFSRSEQIVICFAVSHKRHHEICTDLRRVALSDNFVFNLAFYGITCITFFCFFVRTCWIYSDSCSFHKLNSEKFIAKVYVILDHPSYIKTDTK